jgi:hypothetical protein
VGKQNAKRLGAHLVFADEPDQTQRPIVRGVEGERVAMTLISRMGAWRVCARHAPASPPGGRADARRTTGRTDTAAERAHLGNGGSCKTWATSLLSFARRGNSSSGTGGVIVRPFRASLVDASSSPTPIMREDAHGVCAGLHRGAGGHLRARTCPCRIRHTSRGALSGTLNHR